MKRLFELQEAKLSRFWTTRGEMAQDPANRVVTTGGGTSFLGHDFGTSRPLKELSVQLDLAPRGGECLAFVVHPFLVSIDGSLHPMPGIPPHHTSIARTVFADIVASRRIALRRNAMNSVRIHYSDGRISIRVNEEDPLEFSSRWAPTIRDLLIIVPSHSTIHALTVAGTQTAAIGIPGRTDRYEYHMAIDFNGDIGSAPYTRDMFEAMFDRFRELGLTRVYWMFHGGRDGGLWDPCGNLCLPEKHVHSTFEALGGDPLGLAVKLAHERGLALYATYKPFECAPHGYTFPFGSEPAEKYGKCEVLGGRPYFMLKFPAERRDLWMKRRPWKRASGPVRCIVLTKNNSGPDEIYEIEIWVSDDNWKYRRYEGPRTLLRKPGRFVVDGLEVSNPYLALVPVPQAGHMSFANSLSRLVALFNADGDEIPFTYGLMPRTYPKFEPDRSVHLAMNDTDDLALIGGDFREDGFFFDRANLQWPSAMSNADGVETRQYALDNPEHPVLGIALGKNDAVPGGLCVAEPDTRDFWFRQLSEALDTGVDGVDIRRSVHLNVLEWKDYGFNEVTCEEYKRRYGVDPRYEHFDMEAWRRLRGEYYTQFLREARDLVHSRGKRFQVHIEDTMKGEPDTPTMMEIHWDWRRWLEEEIPDEVTLKVFDLECYRHAFGMEVLSVCQQRGLPVWYCAFVNRTNVLSRPDWRTFFSQHVRNSGVSGFILYEHASLVKAGIDGRLHDVEPQLLGFIRGETRPVEQ